jgi:predicted XRE-type DNA-binding protein
MKRRDAVSVERGSGNVFADLALPDAEAHLLKARLVSRIDALLRERRLTQAKAARLLGLSQPDVSRLRAGSFKDFSMERLFRLLQALGQDVNIVVRQPRTPRPGRLRVAAG